MGGEEVVVEVVVWMAAVVMTVMVKMVVELFEVVGWGVSRSNCNKDESSALDRKF